MYNALRNFLYRLGLERADHHYAGRLYRLFLNLALDFYYWPEARRKFKALLAVTYRYDDVERALTTFKARGFYDSICPIQNEWELRNLAERVNALAPQVIVEIGTRGGGTLFVWSQSNAQLQLLISIDLPGGIHGGGYGLLRSKLYRLFVTNRPLCHLELLRRDSQTEATRTEVAGLLQGRPIDFLFIDGDHRYEGVKKDFELYSTLVRPGGMIAFHDIRPQPANPEVQVYKLWDQIKASGDHVEEFVQEPYCGMFGVGILYKGSTPPSL